MKTETAMRAFRLALDHRTPEPEALVAFRKFRRASMDFHEATAMLAPVKVKDSARRRIVRMPFGQYRGEPLSQVVDRDPEYTFWLLDQDWLSKSLRRVIEREMGIWG